MDRNARDPIRAGRAIMRDTIGERWGDGLEHDITRDVVSVKVGGGIEINGATGTVQIKLGPGLTVDSQGRLRLDLNLEPSEYVTVATPVVKTDFESGELRVYYTDVQLRVVPTFTVTGNSGALGFTLEPLLSLPSTYPGSVDEAEYVTIATTALCSALSASLSIEVGFGWLDKILADEDGEMISGDDGNVALENYANVLTVYYELEDRILTDKNGKPLTDQLGNILIEAGSYSASELAIIDAILVGEDGEPVCDANGDFIALGV